MRRATREYYVHESFDAGGREGANFPVGHTANDLLSEKLALVVILDPMDAGLNHRQLPAIPKKGKHALMSRWIRARRLC